MMLNPDKISLAKLSSLFDYEKMSREIDSCEDVESLKGVAKSYIKLYLATLESISNLNIPPSYE
jgi:hypothetical protein